MAQSKRARRKKRGSSAGTAAVIVLAVTAAVALMAVLCLGAYVAGLNTIFPNIQVAGVDVGGMSYSTAHSTLLNASVGVPAGVQATAKLTEQISVTVTSEQAGLTSSVSDAVDAAYAFGREGGFFANMFTYLKCLRQSHDVVSEQVFNEEGVRAIVAGQAKLVNHDAVDAAWEVRDNELIVTKSIAAYKVDEEGVFEFIRETLLSGVTARTDEFSEAKDPGPDGLQPDFDAIYDQIFKEPVDATYDTENRTATPGEDGVSFDREEMRNLYNSAYPGETVRLALTITRPKVSVYDIEELLFQDLLAEKVTSMKSSSSNRITNITLAAAAVNGTVLEPGDEFSYNGVVGQRTVEKGYKPAGAYVGGRHADEVGGGICQLSSTIYFCTLIVDLEITERTNHGYTVAYLPLGLDATVNWPNLDLKFKNNRLFPIKLVCWVENKELHVQIWGTKENDLRIELESNTIETIPYKTIEKEDPSLAPGERKTENSGQTGYVSEAYKVVYDAEGNVLSRTLISRDTYRAMNKVVLVGPEESIPAGGETEEPGEAEGPGEGEGTGETGEPGEEETPGEGVDPGETEGPGDEEMIDPDEAGGSGGAGTDEPGSTEEPGNTEDSGNSEEPGNDEGSAA